MDSLENVKGIGKATLEDIKRVYSDVSELKEALSKNKVPLRDDIVDTLKKQLL